MKATACLLFLALFVNISIVTHAQEVFSGDTLKVRFNNWAGLGFAPEVVQGRIDSRSWIVNGLSDGAMDFGETRMGGDFGRGISAGRVTTGGVYAFTPAADIRLLGFQPTGTDLSPGSATLKILIGNDVTASKIGVSYDLWIYNDQGRSTLIELEWSTDGDNFYPSNGGGTMTPAAAEVGVVWKKQTASATLPIGEATEGGTLFIRWVMKDGSGTGSRDEWGLEEIRLYSTDDHDEDDDITPPEPPPYADKPTVQARNINLTARSDTSMYVAWDRGNGDYSILAALPDGVTSCETDTSATYDAHPNIHVAGLTKNGCRVLWSGIGNQAIIFGLQPLESVLLTVLEFNGEGGMENYLEDGQEVVSYQTRAKSPPPLESFRVKLVTFEEVTFTWASPVQGFVKVLVVDEIPSDIDLLSFLDGEDTDTEFVDTGCVASPCTVNRDLVGIKYVVAFTIDGPEGHQSIQKLPIAVWQPSWPDPSIGRLLAEWSFDSESSSPSWAVWEHQHVDVSVNGARDRGYATGHSGRASYVDQWHEPSLEKSWTLSMTTHGLSFGHIAFRVISSATGPARFRVVCDIGGQNVTSPQVVDASSTWANSIVQLVELPSPCLDQPQMKLLITPVDDVAMNGNPISRSGTSRLDDVRLYGSYEVGSLPLMGDLILSSNVDAGVTLVGRWISAVGKWPTTQSLKLESQGQVDEKFYVVSDQRSEFHLEGLKPATHYRVSHCGYVGEAYSCSSPIEFATPYMPPAMPVITHYHFKEPDSLELKVSSGGFDVIIVYAPQGAAQPQLADSTASDQLNGTDFRHVPRTPDQHLPVIGGLRPGSHYRIWALSVAGPDSVARYSKPEHPYIDVAIPRLAEPEMPHLEVRLQSKSMHSVAMTVSEPDSSFLLFTITPFGTEPSRPEHDVFYHSGHEYSHGDKIGDATFVINGPAQRTLTVNGLPLGQKWILRVFAFNTLHGSITYSSSFTDFVFETLPDPAQRPMAAPDVWNTAIGDTIATTGSALWINGQDVLLHLPGGNMMFTDPYGRISQTKLPREIALVAVLKEFGIDIIDFRLLDKPTHIPTVPYVVHPDSSNASVYGHAQISLGNVMQTNHVCEDGSPMYRQRGRQPRMICMSGERPGDGRSPFEQEWAVTGHPLYLPSSPYLKVVVTSTSDIDIYTPPVPVLISPNKDQLISWTKNDDTDVEFNWEIKPAQRPYDQFPDSVASSAYFLTRSPDRSLVNMLKLDSGELSRSFLASELHRSHSSSDSLQLTTELEWTVGLYGIGDEVNNGNGLDNWVSFRLLRLKALYDTDVMDIPNEFILEPARPNPFNPSTTLRVHLPDAGDLSIVVHDILGRRVRTIHTGVMKSGVHDFIWNAVRLPSGIYIIRARFGGHHTTQTVTLLK